MIAVGLSWTLWSLFLAGVNSILHPECEIIKDIKRNHDNCLKGVRETRNTSARGCRKLWDGVVCWPQVPQGSTVNVSCLTIFSHFTSNTGSVSRNCSHRGWSQVYPAYLSACVMDDEMPTEEASYFGKIKVVYTVGHSSSLLVLTAAVIILLLFRRLHCTRNYIHIQLFLTFILRGVSILVKDAVLFGDGDINHCTFSTAGCKVSVVFCYFCIMANYFWLLVEGLYLNSLLLASFTHSKKYFWCWSVLGWGVPTICLTGWVIAKSRFEDSECWDTIEDSPYWWIIKAPVVSSIVVNFALFVNIIRILFQKLNPREIHMVNSSQYRRLMKSTLLLIPLFGVHYIVCAFPPNFAVLTVKLYLDLCIGSFQGLIVGVLYCFLNQEVQMEVQRRWRGRHQDSYGAVPVVGKSQMDTPC